MDSFKQYLINEGYSYQAWAEMLKKILYKQHYDSESIVNRFMMYFKTTKEMEEFVNSKIDFYTKQHLKKGIMFYRGFQSLNGIEFKNVRQDRKPKDIKPLAQNIINDWMNKNLNGINRSNTLFVTQDMLEANAYGTAGNTGIVIPIGKYSWVASRKIKDLYSKVGRTTDEEVIKDIMEDAEYKINPDLSTVNQTHEIMIYAKTYIAISLKGDR